MSDQCSQVVAEVNDVIHVEQERQEQNEDQQQQQQQQQQQKQETVKDGDSDHQQDIVQVEQSPEISLRTKTSSLATTLGKCNLDDPIEKSPPPVPHQSLSDPTTPCSVHTPLTSIISDSAKNGSAIPSFSVTPASPPIAHKLQHDLLAMSSISLSRSAPNLSILLSDSQRQNLNNRIISNSNSNNSNSNSSNNTVIPTVTTTDNNNSNSITNTTPPSPLTPVKSGSGSITNSPLLSASVSSVEMLKQQQEQKQLADVQQQIRQQEEKMSSLRDALRESVPPITLGSVDELKLNEHDSNGAGPLVGGVRPSRVGAVFDHFIVVGLPSNIDIKCSAHDERQKHQPQILFTYPEGAPLPNDMIVDFCFPNGIESRSSQRSSSYSSLNQIAFCNLSHLLNTEHSFVFLLNTASALYYGVCIVKEEEVSSLPSFIPEPDTTVKTDETTGRKKLNREQYDFIAPRVYCLLTRFPFFQLHFQVLHSVLERERMLMLFAMTQSQDPTNVATMDIINLYYNINMETIREKIQFKIPGQDLKTDFHCPNGSEDRLIADWSLFNAFESINLEDMITIFAYALMERSILVFSKNLGNCSSFIYSFIPLLRPFTWQCCFIPILPESLNESLDAPFPFLIGIREIPEDVLSTKKDYLIVDIDNRKLILPYNHGSIPPLPGSKKLLDTLTMRRKETFKLQSIIPYDHLKNRYVQEVLSAVHDYHSWMVEQISSGVITCINNMYTNQANTTTIDPPSSIELLNKQSIHFLEDHHKQVVECLPESYQNFFTQFFQSQMFAVNAVRVMLSVQERHRTNISQIEKLESLIQMEEKSKEFLMEYQRLATKRESKVNVDMGIIKQQLKDSEGVISELKESKKKLEMEALAVSPSKNNGSITSFLGLSEIRKKKLEFGHRRSRSVSDQVEKNILKKSVKGPSLSFFDFSGSNNSLKSNLSRSQSPLSVSHNPIMELLEKEDQIHQQNLRQQQQQQQQQQNNSNSNNNSSDESSQDDNESPRNLLLL